MAKQKYTKADMVKFGEYLLSKQREQSLKVGKFPIPYKDRKRDVTDADIANWKDK